MKTLTKGFTLIELLVVIAIIGILSSVVLGSLNTARDKGANAAAKSNLNNARTQSEIYYDSNSRTYTNFCSSGTGNAATIVSAASNVAGVTAECADTSNMWAIEVQLKNSEGYYCVDYTGVSTTTSNGGGSTIQDGSDYVCGA